MFIRRDFGTFVPERNFFTFIYNMRIVRFFAVVLGISFGTAFSSAAQNTCDSDLCGERLAQEVSQLKTRVASIGDIVSKLPKISGYAQLGYQLSDQVSAFEVRSVRLSFAGDLGRKFDYKFQFEFASPRLVDAFIRYKMNRTFNVQFGQYLVPFGIEGPMSILDLETIANAAAVKDICNTPDQRDIGLQFSGEFLPRDGFSIINYAVGVFNGEGKNTADANTSKDIMGRLNIKPMRQLTLSGSFSYGELSETYIKNTRYAAGVQWRGDHLLLRSEYLSRNTNTAGIEQLTDGGYVLAGWYCGNSTICPLVRYGWYDTHMDGKSSQQSSYLVGVDYHPWRHIRLQANYTYTTYANSDNNSGLFALQITGIF